MTMTMSTDVTVKLDDRVRLISAVLALTSFPDTVQAKRPHGTHIHARMTRKNLAEHSQHPAVLDLEMLLAKGAPLEAIYTLALLVRLDEGKLTTKAPAWLPPGAAAGAAGSPSPASPSRRTRSRSRRHRASAPRIPAASSARPRP